MQVNIIIPSRSIEGGISRFLLDQEDFERFQELIDEPIPTCKSLIESDFRSAFEEVNQLFEFEEEPELIRIEVEDDLGKKEPRLLGLFDLYKTESYGHFCFSISAHMVLDRLCRELEIQTTNPHHDQIGLWFHELVHMADWHILKIFSQLKKDDCKRHLEDRSITLRLHHHDIDDRLPREWQFLQVLSFLRDEGLAVLFEILTGHADPYCESGKAAVQEFRKLMFIITSVLLRKKNTHLSNGMAQNYIELLEAVKTRSYTLGPWFMCDILENACQDKELVTAARERLEGRRASPMETENCIGLIKEGLSLDLGSCIRLVSKPGGSHPWGEFIKTEDLMNLLHYLTIEDAELGEYPNFISSVMECAINRDEETLIAVLKTVLGFPMSHDEIVEAMQEFEKQGTDSQVSSRTYQLTKDVYSRWEKSKNDVLMWALTYIFDPEDLINDQTPYIGYLDDLFVLEAVVAAGLAVSRPPHTDRS
jgi:uncharacterized membrane protein YkvA (DUF1232 family)